MTNQTNVPPLNRRQSTEQAIQLAIQGRWEEAEQLNRRLVAAFPQDVDGYNRLGKALTELGRYSDARAAYQQALDLEPANGIARKNLARLATLNETAAPVATGERVDPHLFVEETGKTAVTALQRPATDALARMTAGDRVYVKQEGKSLSVQNSRGEHLGTVEARLALRLIKLMEGGNEYAAAIASLDGHGSRVIIKETYQHPSQAGKLSFPTAGSEGFRPYTRERLVRHAVEDEEPAEEEAEASDDWQEESDTTGGDVSLYTHLRKAEPADKDDEFEE